MRKPALIAAALVLLVVCAGGQRYETAEADSRKADAALGKARAGLATEQNQLAVLGSQKREEEAKLMQTRAALQLAKNDLDNTVIRAPVAGIAGNRAGQIGQYVKPGTQLLSLVPLPRVYVTANFKETQLTRMRPGQPAEISVDAYPDRPLHGQVESFAPGSGAQLSLLPPDNATGNFTKIVQRVPVRIAVPADASIAGLLRPGLSVTVTVDTRRQRETPAGDWVAGAAQARPTAAEPNSARCDGPRRDDPVSGGAGVLRRRDDPGRVPGRLHQIPRPAAGVADGADLADPEPVLDAGADDRRISDRHLFLALAVPGQHRARHSGRRG